MNKGELISVQTIVCRKLNECMNLKCKLKAGDEIPDLYFEICNSGRGRDGLAIHCRSIKNNIEEE